MEGTVEGPMERTVEEAMEGTVEEAMEGTVEEAMEGTVEEPMEGPTEGLVEGPVEEDNKVFTPAYLQALLTNQSNDRTKSILGAFDTCNNTFSVPFDDSMYMFRSMASDDNLRMDTPAKCLIDCVLRGTDVVNIK